MFLDDQHLCIQTSSSFVYAAMPIGASIYVVGDLDTGKKTTAAFSFPEENGELLTAEPLCAQERASTTSASSTAAPGRGNAPSPCCPPTSPKRPALLFAWPTVDCSACSSARACSGSESEPLVHCLRAAPRSCCTWYGQHWLISCLT